MKKNLALVILGVLVIVAGGVAGMKSYQLSELATQNTKLQEQLVIKEAAGRFLVEKLGGWEWHSPEAQALVVGTGITVVPHEGGYRARLADSQMFFVLGEFSPEYRFMR